MGWLARIPSMMTEVIQIEPANVLTVQLMALLANPTTIQRDTVRYKYNKLVETGNPEPSYPQEAVCSSVDDGYTVHDFA